MKNFKRFLALALALVMALTMVACGSSETTTTAAPTEAASQAPGENTTAAPADPSAVSAKDTLIVATENETPSLTTVEHNAVAGDYMNQLTYNGLFTLDDQLTPIPCLIEDNYEVSDDGLTWTFHLKKGVKFHNGNEMKAADVVASLKLCAESPNVQQYGTAGNCEAVDDYTVAVHTETPYAGLPFDLTSHGNFILPADLIASGHDFNADPIGTGPYKLVEWKKGDYVKFESFDDYFEGAPKIKNLTWRIIPEGSARTISLEAGEVDLVIEVESNDLDRLQADEGISVFTRQGTSHNFMMINTEKAPFDNQNFRKALNAAIDCESVVSVAYPNVASATKVQVPTVFDGAVEDGTVEYDPAKAKEYFEASGLNAADCGFPIICSNDAKVRAGQVIQANLKENLGIECTIEQLDLATYLETCEKGNYMAAIGGYTSGSMLTYLKGRFHSSSINASNMTRTNDPELDKMIDEAGTMFDQKELVAQIAKISKYINDLCPCCPIFLNTVVRAYNSKLAGFTVGPSGLHRFQDYYWTE